MATGSRSITSATRRPSIRPVIAVCIEAARAEPLITKPIRASQTPPKTSPLGDQSRPAPMKR